MIKARIYEDKNGHLSFSMKGHAGAAEAGQDIVCSAATILAYTIAQLVKDYEKKGMIKGRARVMLKRGSASVTCTPKEGYNTQVKHSYFVVQTGLNLLAYNYPQYIDVKSFDDE